MYVKNRWVGAAVLGIALAAAPQSVSLAKPPGLPVDNRIACPDGADGPGLTVRLPEAETASPPRAPAAVRGGLVGALVGRVAEELRVLPLRLSAAALAAERRAQDLFEAGDRCRADGDLDGARARYQEAHLLSPTSHYGQRAIQRLMEIEELPDAAEEQEEPARRDEAPKEPRLKGGDAAERAFQRMRAATQPLGTVDIDSY